jgi:hypothetical protein
LETNRESNTNEHKKYIQKEKKDVKNTLDCFCYDDINPEVLQLPEDQSDNSKNSALIGTQIL